MCLSVNCMAQRTAIADVGAFRQRLSAENRQVKSIESDFTQYKVMEIMEKPLVSSGKFYFRNDDKIRMDYLQPEAYLIVLDGQKIKIEAGGKKNVYDTSSNQIASAMQSMLSACLFGDIDEKNSAAYNMSAFETSENYQVEIEPRNKRMKKYIQKIEVVFSKKDLSVDQLTVWESSSDFTRQVFTNKKFNLSLSDQLFNVR